MDSENRAYLKHMFCVRKRNVSPETFLLRTQNICLKNKTKKQPDNNNNKKMGVGGYIFLCLPP